MTRYLMTRCDVTQPRVFANFLALVFLEWTIFYIYVSVGGNISVQKDDFHRYTRSDKLKNTNTSVKVMPQKQKTMQKTANDKPTKTTVKEIPLKQKTMKKTANDKPLGDFASMLNCTKKEIMLSQLPVPVTGLASFPGAGNTWVRHLIQQMTGLGTASMYCDGKLKGHGFPFECNRDRKRTVVVKTHEEDHYKQFKRVVLLIRNPYDALLAYVSMTKAGHTGHPSKQVMVQASNKMFNWSLWWYVDLTNGTLTRFKGPVYVLQYELLKTDMARELRQLSTFLQVNVTDHDIACTIKLQEGNFHRKTSDTEHLNLLRAVYDKEKLLRLHNAANTTAKLLKDTLNLDRDVGGAVEKILLQNVTSII